MVDWELLIFSFRVFPLAGVGLLPYSVLTSLIQSVCVCVCVCVCVLPQVQVLFPPVGENQRLSRNVTVLVLRPVSSSSSDPSDGIKLRLWSRDTTHEVSSTLHPPPEQQRGSREQRWSELCRGGWHPDILYVNDRFSKMETLKTVNFQLQPPKYQFTWYTSRKKQNKSSTFRLTFTSVINGFKLN